MLYCRIKNLLSPESNYTLLRSVLNLESSFVPSTTSTNAEDYRKSMVLYSPPPEAFEVVGMVSELYRSILDELGRPQFDSIDIESQITSHNDGGYYRQHNDNGSPDAANRRLTYVYYFSSPKPQFSGGQLKIYGEGIEEMIAPENNSIVFFYSGLMHEVLPTVCESGKFADGRFTINGWIRG